MAHTELGLRERRTIATLSNQDMKSICDRLNGTPRKCLGWRTPIEAFREELMKLDSENRRNDP